LRIAAIAAVVVACGLANGPAAASSWLPSFLNSSDPATTSAAEAPNERAAAIAQKGTARSRIGTCLSSPADVRKLQPRAWPRWTYGANGERCWYAGKKRVLAKTAPRRNLPMPALAQQPRTPRQPTPTPEAATNALRVWDHQNGDPIWQPWTMEYRWDESFKYIDQTRPAP
jgi:hypothetical protein